MHPAFFDVIDKLDGEICASVWGNVEPEGAVVARARAMRHPERISFGGQTAEPAAALSGADLFFYPLQHDHYGTAENALIEAMSLGLVPVVLNNPAEMAIVRHGETGFVAHSIEECAALLQELLSSPDLREQLSRNAMRHVAETRTPARSAQDFVALWQGLLGELKKLCNFRDIVGKESLGLVSGDTVPARRMMEGIGARQIRRAFKGCACSFRRHISRGCLTVPTCGAMKARLYANGYDPHFMPIATFDLSERSISGAGCARVPNRPHAHYNCFTAPSTLRAA